MGGGLTRDDGLVELVHDAVAVGPFVVQGLRAAEEAGGAEVHLLGLALLAPDEAQLRFRGTNAWGHVVVRGTTLVRRGQSRGYVRNPLFISHFALLWMMFALLAPE